MENIMPTPTGDNTTKNAANFAAYCTAMSALGPEMTTICDELYSPKKTADSWKNASLEDVFYQDKVGDGKTLFPRYAEIMGTMRIGQWYELKHWDCYDYQIPMHTYSRAVFLAGAFGMLEIPSLPIDYSISALGVFREDLPFGIIDKVHKLYEHCLKVGSQKCLKSKDAASLKEEWHTATEHLWNHPNEEPEARRMRELTGRLSQLKSNFSLMYNRTPDREKLQSAIASYLSDLPINPSTREELAAAIKRYRLMIKLVILQQHGQDTPPDTAISFNKVQSCNYEPYYYKHKPKWGLRND